MPRLARCGRMRLIMAIAVALTASPSSLTAQSATLSPTAPALSLADSVAEAARRFSLPESWLWAIMRVESGGNPRALSPAGAMGLMQIMPATWAMLSARYALGPDPYAVRANVHAGAAYLREMLDRYGDLGIALAAYNAGPARVDDWRSSARPLPAATPFYVARITSAVGASGTSAAAAPLAQPISWRSATLFIVRGNGASAGTVAAGITPPIGKTPAPSPPDFVQRPPANPLFVAPSGRIAP